MIELFSRTTNVFSNAEYGGTCIRIPIGEDISSLSAILLNDAYYGLLREGTIQIGGISLLSEAYLLLFKAKAYLDLLERKENGEAVDSRDIKKHKNDIVRLTTILSPDKQVNIEDGVKDDIREFVQVFAQDKDRLNLPDMPNLTKDDILARIKYCYQI